MAQKARFFSGLVYPDSAPDDWRQQLEDSLGMWLISPLHDPDVTDESVSQQSGTALDPNRVGKLHWHVMYCHGNTISAAAAREIFPDWVYTSKIPNKFMVTAACNLARYFCHLDQPKKQQFPGDPYELLTALNGFPLSLDRQLTSREKRQMRLDVQALVDARSFTEFADLSRFLGVTHDWEMFDFVNDNYGWAVAYLQSVRNKAKWAAEQRKRAD